MSPRAVEQVGLRYLRRAAEDSLFLRFLVKLAKRTKGLVDLDLLARVFAALPGWRVEPVSLAVDLSKSSNGLWILEGRLKTWMQPFGNVWIHDDDTTKRWKFGFRDSRVDVEEARKSFLHAVEVVHAPPPAPVSGRLYATAPSPAGAVGHLAGFEVERMWLGVHGWKLTAPTHATAVVAAPITAQGRIAPGNVHNLASLWTFVYKNGLDVDAQKYLNTLHPEKIEQATATKAEREHMERRRESSPQIEAVFREITDRKYAEVAGAILANFLGQMQMYLNKIAEGDRHPSSAGMHWTLISKMLERVNGDLQPRSNHEAIARAEAEKIATAVRDAFIEKNTYRVSAIVNKKGNFAKAQLVRINPGHDYGGEVRFSFADGSSFLLRNKTVWKRSGYGVEFAQFPTTFHEVTLPDGSKMPQPSEARMLDVFAKI
jgi:hypothetical protein